MLPHFVAYRHSLSGLALLLLCAAAGLASEDDPPKKPKSIPANAKVEPAQNSATKRRLLKPTDLVYQGSFAPPKNVQGISTSYTNIGLAMRIIAGKPRFFAGAGPDDAGVYEMNFPGLTKLTTQNKACPSAKVVRWWGDVSQGRCIVANKGNAVVKHGLFWDETTQRLYWTYGSHYNASASNDPCIGWSDLSGLAPVAHGPFRVAGGRASPNDKSTRAVSGSCRGGVLRIPSWFAKQYTDKRTLGVGFGGYYNIISAGVSMGPALFAVEAPQNDKSELHALPCVAHTFTSPGAHYAKRKASYSVPSNDWPGIAPVNGVGYWTAMDIIQNACCWIDLPDVSGLIFAPSLTKGVVSYEVMNKRAPSGGSENWLYIYAPADVAAVAQGKKMPWAIDPATSVPFPTPLGGRINGLVFDQTTRTLFVLAIHAYNEGAEAYPLVHAFRVLEGAKRQAHPQKSP